MKEIGILLLFLLAALIGFRRAAGIDRKREWLSTVREDAAALLLQITVRRTPLQKALEALPNRTMRRCMENRADTEPAPFPAVWRNLRHWTDTVRTGSLHEIESEGQAFLTELDRLFLAVQEESGQANLYRTLGVLCGAVIVVLLW